MAMVEGAPGAEALRGPGLPALTLGVGAALVYVATRAELLLRESLNNDEIANRYYAAVLPLGVYPPHPLTYWLVRLGENLGGDAWAIRLPFVLIATAAAALLVWAVARWRGPVAGALTGLLLALNPLLLYTANTANHYSVLFAAGALSIVAAGFLGMLERGRWWAVLLSSVGLLALATRSHPAGFVPLGGLLTAGFIMAMHHPQRVLGLPPTVTRIAAVLVAVTGAALAIRRAGELGAALSGPLDPQIVQFSLSPVFLAGLLGELLSAWPLRGWPDTLIGCAAFVVAIAGWAGVLRRTPLLLPAAIAAAAMILAAALFHLLNPSPLHFSSRYVIHWIPPILMGWAMAMPSNRDELRAPVPLAGMLVGALLLVRLTYWAPIWFGGHVVPFEPSIARALDVIPADTPIASRNQYVHQAAALAAERIAPGSGSRFVHLGENAPSSRAAANHALMLAATSPNRDVALLDFEYMDEFYHVDYHQFARAIGVEVLRFPSIVAWDGRSLDRSVVLRRVPDLESFGVLPMAGANAVRLMPSGAALFTPRRGLNEPGTPQLLLREGGAATWWIRSFPAAGVAVQLSQSIAEGFDRHFTGTIEHGGSAHHFHFHARQATGGPGWISIVPPESMAGELAGQPILLSLFLPKVVKADGSLSAQPPTQIVNLMADAERQAWPIGQATWLFPTATGGAPPTFDAATPTDYRESFIRPESATAHVVCIPFRTDGLRAAVMVPSVHLTSPRGNARHDLLASMNTHDTRGWLYPTLVIEAGHPATALESRLRLRRASPITPGLGGAEAAPTWMAPLTPLSNRGRD